MERNELLSGIQVVFGLIGIWGLLGILFFYHRDISGEFGVLLQISAQIRNMGMSISLFLGIIILQMFKTENE